MLYRYTANQFHELVKGQYLMQGIPSEHREFVRSLPLAAAQAVRAQPDKRLSVFVSCGNDTLGGKVQKIYLAKSRRQGEGGSLVIDPNGIETVLYDRASNRSLGWQVSSALKPATKRARSGFGWIHQKIYGGAGPGQAGVPLNYVAQAAAPHVPTPPDDEDLGYGGGVVF